MLNFERAKIFYEQILKKRFTTYNLNGFQHGFWEHSKSTIGGALVGHELKTSKEGVLVNLPTCKD